MSEQDVTFPFPPVPGKLHVEQTPGNQALPPKIKIWDKITVTNGDFVVELTMTNHQPAEKAAALITQCESGRMMRTDLKGLIDLTQALEEIRRMVNAKIL